MASQQQQQQHHTHPLAPCFKRSTTNLLSGRQGRSSSNTTHTHTHTHTHTQHTHTHILSHHASRRRRQPPAAIKHNTQHKHTLSLSQHASSCKQQRPSAAAAAGRAGPHQANTTRTHTHTHTHTYTHKHRHPPSPCFKLSAPLCSSSRRAGPHQAQHTSSITYNTHILSHHASSCQQQRPSAAAVAGKVGPRQARPRAVRDDRTCWVAPGQRCSLRSDVALV